MVLPIHVVRRKMPDGSWDVLSAWPNIYDAKYEAQRWEQDLKIEHDYVDGVLVIGGEDGGTHQTLPE